ncbi:hypothetical protein GCM10009678_25870 [Actinomadura kijaniata]|uniref:Flp pilus assembly pilin Flp n=1 Tax=Actinomadura namibiensis TaxID=182080 RepID=A0A7W3LUJ9_ACTNM|nr:hypothetical protein [Actinomadura namibiensis]MBA8954578.1 Flp pilus assembly pilin Flp [Actinomadura namibiensis]
MNPQNDPLVVYLKAMLDTRVRRLRDGAADDTGASAVEWAIITGLLALLAIAVGGIIYRIVTNKANSINVG